MAVFDPHQRIATLENKLQAAQLEIEWAHLKIQVLEERLRQRRIQLLGPFSETLSDLQLELLVDEEPSATAEEVEAEAGRESLPAKPERERKPHPGRRTLPETLPRLEQVIPCTEPHCKTCGGETRIIGYDESEQLDHEPARWFVRVVKREKRACGNCSTVAMPALAPRIVEKGLSGAMRAIEAGLWSIEHSIALDDEAHKLMAKKGIWRVGTETPISEYYSPSPERFQKMVDGMKNAYANGVKMAFSTDADYYIPGKTRGEVVIDFLRSWKAAGIPAPEILKIMTTNGYKVCDIDTKRGPIKPGFAADLIAVKANPLEDIDTLKDVRFVLKDGMVFKRDGVMTPEKFFNSGPVNGWRLR
jgi:transposase